MTHLVYLDLLCFVVYREKKHSTRFLSIQKSKPEVQTNGFKRYSSKTPIGYG